MTTTAALSTNHAAVATHHPHGASAAKQILEAGGNAIDAAVAAMTALCVVIPSQVGLGGYGGSMVVYLAKSRKVVAIDFDSRAPLEFRDDLFADDAANKSSHGYLACTVPAIVAGLATALREFGTMSWKQVTQPAYRLAHDGYAMEPEGRGHLEKWYAAADPLSRRALLPDGKIPQVGETWRQPDLARLIARLGDEGPESFYRGEISGAIVKQIREHGGILSAADFANYKPTITEPLKINYRGYDVFTPPPPSGGITMLQILKTLETFDMGTMTKWGASYLHLVAETAKLCWADRARTLGDPDFVQMPIDELLSTESAAARAAELKKHEVRTGGESVINTGPHTSNVSVIDREGNVVSVTATQGYQFGSRIVIDGLGLVMGQGMSRFEFKSGHPNRPEPGKRMHHNMAPTITLRGDGSPFAAIGLPGGPKILTVTAQLLVNLIDFGCSAREAVTAPRVHAEGAEPIGVSKSLDLKVVGELESMGHRVERGQTVGGPPDEIAGYANAVVVGESGEISAASSASPRASYVI